MNTKWRKTTRCALLRQACLTGTVLTILLTALVLLASGLLASRAGEVAYENDRDGN